MTQFRKVVLFVCLAAFQTTQVNLAKADVPLQGFADLGYDLMNSGSGSESTKNYFYHGQIDLFLSKSLSDKVNFISETVFELDEISNEARIDPERIIVQYFASPWFRFGAGRFHTAIGYWNEAYHHGSWLFAPITRPLIQRFEDNGGILPVHLMGLEFRGEGSFGPGKLGYIANIGNGRGPQIDPPQIMSDANMAKALNLLLYYFVPKIKLRIGLNTYFDQLPGYQNPLNLTTPLVNVGSEQIFGGHVLWEPGNLQLLSEAVFIQHRYTSGETNADVFGNYIQLSYRIANDYIPYFRFDMTTVSGATLDSYSKLFGTQKMFTLGMRYDLDDSNGLKIEVSQYSNDLIQEKKIGANWAFTW